MTAKRGIESRRLTMLNTPEGVAALSLMKKIYTAFVLDSTSKSLGKRIPRISSRHQFGASFKLASSCRFDGINVSDWQSVMIDLQ